MKRKTIITILLVFLILILAGAGYYFFFRPKDNKEELKLTQGQLIEKEGLLEFKNYDQSLSPEQINKYQQDFEERKNFILANPGALNPSAWLTLAKIKKYVKDYEGAEKIYLFLIKFDAANYIPENNLADLYANYLFNYEKAAEHYWQAVKKSVAFNKPMGLMFYRSLADIYAFKLISKISEFESQALVALKNDYVGSVDFLTMLAKFYKDSGNKNEAIKYLEAALKLDPTNQTIKDDLTALKGN